MIFLRKKWALANKIDGSVSRLTEKKRWIGLICKIKFKFSNDGAGSPKVNQFTYYLFSFTVASHLRPDNFCNVYFVNDHFIKMKFLQARHPNSIRFWFFFFLIFLFCDFQIISAMRHHFDRLVRFWVAYLILTESASCQIILHSKKIRKINYRKVLGFEKI